MLRGNTIFDDGQDEFVDNNNKHNYANTNDQEHFVDEDHSLEEEDEEEERRFFNEVEPMMNDSTTSGRWISHSPLLLVVLLSSPGLQSKRAYLC